MAVILRLARHGTTGKPIYRLVAADKVRWRNGKFIEVLGTFNPKNNPHTSEFDEERVRRWVGVGAQYSDRVRDLIRKAIPGLIETREENQTKKVQLRRKKRKMNAQGRAKAERKTKAAKTK